MNHDHLSARPSSSRWRRLPVAASCEEGTHRVVFAEARVQPSAWRTCAGNCRSRARTPRIARSPRIVCGPPTAVAGLHGAVWRSLRREGRRDPARVRGQREDQASGPRHGVAGDYELALDLRHFESDYGRREADATSNWCQADCLARERGGRHETIGRRRRQAGRRWGSVERIRPGVDERGREVVGWTFVEAQKYDAATRGRRSQVSAVTRRFLRHCGSRLRSFAQAASSRRSATTPSRAAGCLRREQDHLFR